jgi:hypothetical protein
MEVLLIDMGALAMFLAYVAIVYWRGVSYEAQRSLTAPVLDSTKPLEPATTV